jgi:NhaP-type Na+/H+ or K+/H+ antiporter
MEEYLVYLTSIAVILLIGLFIALIAKKIKMSNLLLLLIAGIILSKMTYYGERLFSFSGTFLTALAVLALVMIIFDAASRFKWKTIDTYTIKTLKLVLLFLLLNMIFLTAATYYMFDVGNVLLAMIFSSIMVGTSPDVILSMLKNEKHQIVELLRIESIINTPITVLIPFILLDLLNTLNLHEVIFSKLLEQLKPFITQFVVGIGAGVLIGLILARVMKKAYSETLSPLAMITAALLTYILAENIGGNGVLAVTVMGLMFGNFYVKQKDQLYSFSTIFENSLLILVFVLVGIGIDVPLNDGLFWFKAFLLFLIYLILRFISIAYIMKDEGLEINEKLFMTFNIPKGIAVAVVAFTLTTKIVEIPKLSIVLNLIVMFMLFSMVLATIVSKFDHWFLDHDKQEIIKEEKKEVDKEIEKLEKIDKKLEVKSKKIEKEEKGRK